MDARKIRKRRSSKLRWELDVSQMIPSKAWLKNYGLKKNKLDLHQLLPTIGFKLSDDYDTNLKRPVASRYGSHLFRRAFRKDGNTYNLKCSKDALVQIHNRLKQVMRLFERRLSWLTSESRRTFGVIEEKCVTVVLDIKNLSPQQFNQFIGAFQLVLEEQLSRISKFNLVRSAEEIQLFREQCVPVTHDTIYEATEWIKKFDRLAPINATAACEAVFQALQDPSNEAVYLLTEGTSIDACRELFMEKLSNKESEIPVHVVSYNCDNIDTIKYLRRLASCNKGRFHAYAVTMEMLTYDHESVDDPNSNGVTLKRNMYGGMPEGAGVREDVMSLFEEFEEARNTAAFIDQLIKESNWDAPPPKNDDRNSKKKGKAVQDFRRKESSMGSAEWLKRYGLEVNKLEFHDALSKVTFDHVEGVTDIYHNTNHEKKLVDAIYCENLFPAVRWTDGTVKHVIVTPEIHRSYEQKITVIMNKLQERMKWLNKGSRALFGTIIEDNIYILIDSSKSMEPHMNFVKEKLQALINEQLRHKKTLNIVSYGTSLETWSSKLVDITPSSLRSAWNWIQALTCGGSTNTYAAIQQALSDPKADGVYLLTDGCPDQPPKSIIAQVLMKNRLPIHTIAFNCNNTDANNFLYELACATNGRFHHFSEYYVDESQPQPWVSEDLKLLKREYERAAKNLRQISDLRDKCQEVYWKKAIQELKNQPLRNPKDKKVHASRITQNLNANSFPIKPLPQRPRSAPPPKSSRDPKQPSCIKRRKRCKSKPRRSAVSLSASASISSEPQTTREVSRSLDILESVDESFNPPEAQNLQDSMQMPESPRLDGFDLTKMEDSGTLLLDSGFVHEDTSALETEQ